MHCENCGGNLSLEELVCPHCGTINKHAQQHVYDMNRYKDEFKSTQSNVYQVTGNYVGITVRAVIIAVLLIIIVIFGAVAAGSYDIKRTIKENHAKINYKKNITIMDEYLANEDYLAFAAFCDAKYIRGYGTGDDEPYQRYHPSIRVCSQYKYLYQSILRAQSNLLKSYANEETRERDIERIAEDLENFYDTTDLEEEFKYYDEEIISYNKAIVETVVNKVGALLQTYCDLTSEEVEMLPTLSDAKRRVLLEEKMLDAE